MHRFDHIKIYPTLRLPYTQIANWGKDRWKPYSEENAGRTLTTVSSKIIGNLPVWIRVARIFRDMPEASKKKPAALDNRLVWAYLWHCLRAL